MELYTTLNRIRENAPCAPGWQKLLSFLNKTQADDEPLNLLTILESNGVSDCLWAFRCIDDNNAIYRLIAADFAESVLPIYEKHYPGDGYPRKAIQTARDYANHKANAYELFTVRSFLRSISTTIDDASPAGIALSAVEAATNFSARQAVSWAGRSAVQAATWDTLSSSTTPNIVEDILWNTALAAECEKQKQILIKHLS